MTPTKAILTVTASCSTPLFNTTMSKLTLLLRNMFKKLAKRKPRSSSSSGLVQQQPSRTSTANPALDHPALSLVPLVDYSTNEAALSTNRDLGTSVTAPTATSFHLETRSASLEKDAVVNILKLLLKILSDIPGSGVKAALSGLLIIVERVQVC